MEREDLEVLSPAGDYENFKTAIACGADAVYLGLNNFNARAKAENFTLDNIRDVVKYAHLFNVKVYVTINTLVSDAEFKDFLKLVDVAYLAKVDAFIIQDLGVAKILKDRYKNIVLHASTQMGINNYKGALIAEKLGFKRVVLSRETSLEDIRLIKEKTNLEIEFFVQGALCVGFSGNCYFSSLKHNKSGNRGECLQLCRLKYSTNFSKDEKYYLSTKDLCLINELKLLIDAGVTSFKIEGRLRRASYVAQATKSYVKAIKLICDGNFDVNEINSEIENLKKVFVRGGDYCKAYLNYDNSNIINPNYNNHTGIEIGEVESVSRFKDLYAITIFSKEPINSSDGLKFIAKNYEQISVGVGNIEKLKSNVFKIYSKYKPNVGDKVYKITDSVFENGLVSVEKKLPINLKLKMIENKKIAVWAECNDIILDYETEFMCESAENICLNFNSVKSQFEKLKSTNFILKSFDVEMGDVYVSKSVLNKVRNDIVCKMEKQLVDEYEEKFDLCVKDINLNLFLKNNLKNDFNVYLFDDIKMLKGFKIGENDYVIYKPQQFSYNDFDEVMEFISGKYHNFGVNIPAFANKNDLNIIDNIINKFDKITILIDNIYGFIYKTRKNNIICNYSINAFNSATLNVLSELGASAVVRSVEYVDGGFKNKNFITFAYGKVNLMTFVHCPFKVAYGCNCDNCCYLKGLSYNLNGDSFAIKRCKLSKCYFYLKDNKLVNKIKGSSDFIDLT